MKKRLLSLMLVAVVVALSIPTSVLFVSAAQTANVSKWEKDVSVQAPDLLGISDVMPRFFQWFKKGEETPLAIGTALDASCVAKINPALIAEGIFSEEDTLTAAYEKFCNYLKQKNELKLMVPGWSFGNVKQAGTYTEIKYFAHYHNCTLLLAGDKVLSCDGNGYFAPTADWDKMMKDIMDRLLTSGLLMNGTGSSVTAENASAVKVKDLSVTWCADAASIAKYVNLTNGTTALGFLSGKGFAGYNANDQLGYRYTAPKDGELTITMDAMNSDGTYKWNIMINDEFQQSDWRSAADDSVTEINAALAALGSMQVKAGDSITIVLERDGGKHFTPTITASLVAKSSVRFLDKNGEEITTYAVDAGAAMPTPPYAAAAEGWIINGEAAAELPATVTGDMDIQYAGDFTVAEATVEAVSISVASNFAINLYLQGDPYATRVGVADDYGKQYWGVAQEDGSYKVTIPGVNAKEMDVARNLWLSQEFVDGSFHDAKAPYAVVPTDILAGYATSDASAAEKAIAAAALDYAAAAKAYFAGETLDADVKARLAAQDAAIAALESDVARADGGDYVVDAVTLVLKDQVAFKIRAISSLYLELEESVLDYTVSVEGNGTSDEYSGFVYTDGDEGYSVTMTLGGIAPADFDATYTITVKDDSFFVVTEAFEYSVNDYIARTFDANAKEADLLRAIYALGAAANNA